MNVCNRLRLITHNNGAQTETVKNLIHGHECARQRHENFYSIYLTTALCIFIFFIALSRNAENFGFASNLCTILRHEKSTTETFISVARRIPFFFLVDVSSFFSSLFSSSSPSFFLSSFQIFTPLIHLPTRRLPVREASKNAFTQTHPRCMITRIAQRKRLIFESIITSHLRNFE